MGRGLFASEDCKGVVLTTQTLEIELWPFERLLPSTLDPRLHSARQVAQIGASIAEFGFNNPVLVDPTGSISAGHAHVLAAGKLVDTEIPVIVLLRLAPKRKAQVVEGGKR